MLRKPTCQFSHQPCERVCVHPECTSSAFLCSTIDGCEFAHKHSSQSLLVSWSVVEQLNTDIFKKTDDMMKTTLMDVTEKVEIIIGEMRQTLSRYVERLN